MSSDRDFLKTASKLSKAEADEFLGKLKSSSALEAGKSLLKTYGPEIGSAGAGATLAAISQYLASRPGKSGLSKEQELTRAAAKAHGPEKKDESFARGMSRTNANLSREFADVLAKHPGRAAMLAAPIGAGGGLALLRLVRKLKGAG